MDRAGKAASQSFRFFSHQTLMDIVKFDLTEQNLVLAVGTPVWAVPKLAGRVVKVTLAEFRHSAMAASSSKEQG